MNQRTWQMAAMITAGCALAGCAAASGAGATKPAPPSGDSRAARCGPRVLTLAYGPGPSPATGEHGVFYELVNHGCLACTLAGYPHITLSAGGNPLPFRYAFGGGPYVTGRPPATVTLQPGGAAWILVAKYRCDLGDLRDATTVTPTVPGTASALTGPLPRHGGASALTYCRGGADNPGQTVTVSPIEPALQRRQPLVNPLAQNAALRRVRRSAESAASYPPAFSLRRPCRDSALPTEIDHRRGSRTC